MSRLSEKQILETRRRDFNEASHAETLGCYHEHPKETRGKQHGDSEGRVRSVSGRCEKNSPSHFCWQAGLVTAPFF